LFAYGIAYAEVASWGGSLLRRGLVLILGTAIFTAAFIIVTVFVFVITNCTFSS
jgi:hypothetical protein